MANDAPITPTSWEEAVAMATLVGLKEEAGYPSLLNIGSPK